MAGQALTARFDKPDDNKEVDECFRLWRAYAIRINRGREPELNRPHHLSPFFWPPLLLGEEKTPRTVYIRRIADLRMFSVDFLEQFLKSFGNSPEMVRMRISAPAFHGTHYSPPDFRPWEIRAPLARRPANHFCAYSEPFSRRKSPMLFAVYVTADGACDKDPLKGRLQRLLHMNDPASIEHGFTRGHAWLGLMDDVPHNSKADVLLATLRFEPSLSFFQHAHKGHTINQCFAHFRMAIDDNGPGRNPTTFATGHFAILGPRGPNDQGPEMCTIVRVVGTQPVAMECEVSALLHNLIPLEMGFLTLETCRLADPQHRGSRMQTLIAESNGPGNCPCQLCKGKLAPVSYNASTLGQQQVKDFAAQPGNLLVPTGRDPFHTCWPPA